MKCLAQNGLPHLRAARILQRLDLGDPPDHPVELLRHLQMAGISGVICGGEVFWTGAQAAVMQREESQGFRMKRLEILGAKFRGGIEQVQ